MGKGTNEIAAEILQEVIKAKASIIAATGNYETKKAQLEEHLGDKAVAELFKTIIKAVDNPYDVQ